MSFIAPAGTPISLATFSAGLARGLTPTVDARFGKALAKHAQHQSHWMMSTGRAAMVLALEGMRDAANDPKRNEVIVPAYTCYSVPASVLKAGLRPRLCDIDPQTLSMDLESLEKFDFSRVLAIVTANLYGIPNELADIEAIARRANVWLLDDAAQALGATYGGRPVGGFGDVGLYSFDKGKNITSLEGGAILATHPPLVSAIDRLYEVLPGTPWARTAMTVAKLGVYSLMLRPRCYGVVRRLPGLGLGRTVYEDTYPLQKYSSVLAGFSEALFAQLESLGERRRATARSLMEMLSEMPDVMPILLASNARPVFTRLPILVKDAARKAALIENFEKGGIGATGSYPCSLNDVPEVARVLPSSDRNMPGARHVAAHIVTLPTHPYCPPDLCPRIAEVIRQWTML